MQFEGLAALSESLKFVHKNKGNRNLQEIKLK